MSDRCKACKHDSKEWYELPCDYCCGAHSGYEPKENGMYIKREDAIRAIAEQDMFAEQMNSDYASDDIKDYIESARDLLSDVPSADVVEVVRCKDCWKRPFDNCPFYEHLGYQPEDDFFCGEGERKDNE